MESNSMLEGMVATVKYVLRPIGLISYYSAERLYRWGTNVSNCNRRPSDPISADFARLLYRIAEKLNVDSNRKQYLNRCTKQNPTEVEMKEIGDQVDELFDNDNKPIR